ncbi:MAG: 50S ribosomal protein L10 [Deltaproteobacteria bacterium]|nr:50S ribosomal protein L10 [Candidatus Zymogenaceae bacterium]
MKKKEKEVIVSAMHTALTGSRVLFLTDYRGLTAEQINELRGGFRKVGVKYRVVKNNLLKRAAEGTEFERVVETLTGPTGVIVSESDPVEASKILVEYMAKYNVLSYKAGILRGRDLGEADIKSIAKLPPRPVLLAKFLGAMNAVPGGFVGVLSGVMRKFVYALAAVKEAKEAGKLA